MPGPSDARSSAEDAVFKYLERQNRPYNANDVFSNMRGAVGKSAVVSALAALAASDRIEHKVYGKQTVYFPRQKDSEGNIETSCSDEVLTAMRAELDVSRTAVADSTAKLRKAQAQLRQARSFVGVSELRRRMDVAHKRLEVLRHEEITLAAQPSCSPEEARKSADALVAARTAYSSAQRRFRTAWGAVAESAEAEAAARAAIAIIDDSDVGFSISDYNDL